MKAKQRMVAILLGTVIFIGYNTLTLSMWRKQQVSQETAEQKAASRTEAETTLQEKEEVRTKIAQKFESQLKTLDKTSVKKLQSNKEMILSYINKDVAIHDALLPANLKSAALIAKVEERYNEQANNIVRPYITELKSFEKMFTVKTFSVRNPLRILIKRKILKKELKAFSKYYNFNTSTNGPVTNNIIGLSSNTQARKKFDAQFEITLTKAKKIWKTIRLITVS